MPLRVRAGDFLFGNALRAVDAIVKHIVVALSEVIFAVSNI